MIFIAYVETYNDETRFKNHHVAFAADDFASAMTIVENYFKDEIEKITLLEPISDSSSVIFLDKEAEDHIREHPFNAF